VSRFDPGALEPCQPSREDEPPRGRIENSVAALWRDVLRVERVGRNDNFFALGGDSLSGMTVIWRIAEALHVPPPLVSIFAYPTVADMAALIEQLLARNVAPPPSADPEREEGVI
jgi:acyl carrier protein